jgi:hypothetical protein
MVHISVQNHIHISKTILFVMSKKIRCFNLFFQLGVLRPILVLVILIVGHVQSQSVEQLLAQAKATESIENLLADAVVEKSEDSFANPEENLVKLMRSKTSTTSTTTEPPISNRRRLLFKPRDEQTRFFNRVRTPLRTRTATTTTSRQPSILFVIYERDKI